MVDWARLHQLNGAMTRHFVDVISIVDADFMRKQKHKIEAQNHRGGDKT